MFNKSNDDIDDFKKKRQQYSVNIRRNNREQILNKRRNISELHNGESNNSLKGHENETIVDVRFAAQIKKFQQEIPSQQQIPNYMKMLQSPQIMTQMFGLIALRTLADSQKGDTIKQIFNYDIIKYLLKFIQEENYLQLKFQALWMISNITYVDGVCEDFVKHGIIPIILGILGMYQGMWDEHALAILGNLSADNILYRDMILQAGGLEIMYKIFNNASRTITFQNVVWAITNLCRGTPPPDYSKVETAIPVLCKALKRQQLQNVATKPIVKLVSDILWTLSNFTEDSKHRVDRVLGCQILPNLFALAQHKVSQIYQPALKIIGNFSYLSEKPTQILLDNGVLDLCFTLLSHQKSKVRKQICWLISNIAAGTSIQVNKLLTRMDIFDKLNEMFKSDEKQVVLEISWIYPNLGYLGSRPDIVKLMQHYDTIKNYTEWMDQKLPVQLLENILKTLFKVLIIGNKALVGGNNVLLFKFLEYGGVEKLQKLQTHQSMTVYRAAVAIIKKFFQLQDN